jgi:hypothetical protein
MARKVLLVAASILAAAAMPAGATVLTFNQTGTTNGTAINQAYGDNVGTSFSNAAGTYGSGGGQPPM